MFLRRVEAEDYLAATRGGHRRIPFERVPVFGMKANDGIVAAVYRRDRGSRRSKIDSKKHNDLSRQSGGLAPTFVFTGCRRGWGRCYDLTLIALLRSWGTSTCIDANGVDQIIACFELQSSARFWDWPFPGAHTHRSRRAESI